AAECRDYGRITWETRARDGPRSRIDPFIRRTDPLGREGVSGSGGAMRVATGKTKPVRSACPTRKGAGLRTGCDGVRNGPANLRVVLHHRNTFAVGRTRAPNMQP